MAGTLGSGGTTAVEGIGRTAAGGATAGEPVHDVASTPAANAAVAMRRRLALRGRLSARNHLWAMLDAVHNIAGHSGGLRVLAHPGDDWALR